MKTAMPNPATCFACGATSDVRTFVSVNTHGRTVVDASETFPVYHCHQCDAFYLGGITVDEAYYRKHYDESYYQSAPPVAAGILNRVVEWLAVFSVSRKARLCRRLLVGNVEPSRRIRVLDVGCGTGEFLRRLDTQWFERYGVEVNPRGVEASRRAGLVVYDRPLVEADFGGARFDVVTLFSVLEHLPNPVETLRVARGLLNKEGFVLLSVPNSNSLGFQWGRGNWFHLDSPRHLFIPSRRTLEFAADAAGLRVTRCFYEWYDYPLDLFWSVRHSAWRWSVWLLYPLWKRFSPETLTFVLRSR